MKKISNYILIFFGVIIILYILYFVCTIYIINPCENVPREWKATCEQNNSLKCKIFRICIN
ncbi:MAG: hypothetical protein US30_C0001G0066 [Candidatus Moranbacteria bacterium GW2011_GWF2_36_839]|nr:MAG: hypothetical protein US27_C0001G0066 [Candidatus Moranbacteria bacterium GW2011_GWF1_36_78]KKQ17732.1 MAG: hypothetical protein US30_C0001G0066 [Candidatus Moranbacteria bacterium GW2011_GWF2_36_839]